MNVCHTWLKWTYGSSRKKKRKKEREAKDCVGEEEEEHSSQIWLLLYRLSCINRKRNLFLFSNFYLFCYLKKNTLYSCIYLSSFPNKSWDLPNKGQLSLKPHCDIKDEKFDICPINLVRRDLQFWYVKRNDQKTLDLFFLIYLCVSQWKNKIQGQTINY